MLFAQSDRGEVLPLRLSTQAEPERTVGWKNLRRGRGHNVPIPTQPTASFQLRAGAFASSSGLPYFVNFNQTDAGSVVFALQNSCVVPGCHRHNNRSLEIIRRREASSLDFGLLSVFPI